MSETTISCSKKKTLFKKRKVHEIISKTSKSSNMQLTQNSNSKEITTIEDSPNCDWTDMMYSPNQDKKRSDETLNKDVKREILAILDNVDYSNSSDSEIEISCTPPKVKICNYKNIIRKSLCNGSSTPKGIRLRGDLDQSNTELLFEDEPSLLDLSAELKSNEDLSTPEQNISVICDKQSESKLNDSEKEKDLANSCNKRNCIPSNKVDDHQIKEQREIPDIVLMSQNTKRPTSFSNVNNVKVSDIEKSRTKFQSAAPSEVSNNESTDSAAFELELTKFYLKHKDLKTMYSWQQKCLQTVGKKNLVVSLPTSAGKTLVAELLMLREIVIFNKSVIFILPFVALVQEKYRSLSSIAIEMDFFLEEYAGVKGTYPPVKRRHDKKSIYICTIEKSSSLINSFICEDRLNEIGLVVVDEIHILNECGRGPILECLLTKLLYYKRDIQIFGMSATIGNISELANFIKGEPFVEDFRPTSLKEYIKVDKRIFIVNSNRKEDENIVSLLRHLSVPKQPDDPDDISYLLENGLPSLIFCSNKKCCNNLAHRLKLNDALRDHKTKEKQDLLEALKIESSGHLCSILSSSIPNGIAYHHSGLSSGERKLIEEAYLDGTLKIICCTSTLAAGINLPAKRVIIREPYVARDFISFNMYKQMVGRAGRTGMQESGESVIICKTEADLRKLEKILKCGFENVVSKIDHSVAHDLIISVIEVKLCSNVEEVKNLFKYTLMFQQIPDDSKVKFLEHDLPNTINELLKNEVIKVESDKNTGKESLVLTNIAKAAVHAGLSLQDSKVIYKDLCDAKKKLCILNSVHLLSLVIPFKYRIANAGFGVEMKYLMKRYSKFNKTEISAAEMMGVTEQLVALNTYATNGHDSERRIFLCQFLHAVVLYDVLNHEDAYAVAKFYNITLGELYNFIHESVYFSAKVYRFSECLGEFWAYKQLLTDLPQKLACCRTPEVISLMELPGVKMGRAKQLYNAGFTNLEKLSVANPMDLVQTVKHMPRGVARNIIASAKILIQREIDENESTIEKILKENARKKELRRIPQSKTWKTS